MNLQDISVTLLTKNSEKYLKQVLNALQVFGEVLMYDNGSTDQSMEIAAHYPNVNIVRGTFLGFGPTFNAAAKHAKHDWILSIDHDEIVTPELIEAVKNETLDLNTVYSFVHHNYFNDKWIKGCGWYPDRKTKLYNRTQTHFNDVLLHEALKTSGLKQKDFSAPIIHYSYDTISDFLNKMQSYSSLFAKQNCGKKKSSLGKAITHGIVAFIKSYVLKKGFLDGAEGFIISAYNGHTAYYKYLKLREANSRTQRL
ncbi:MAG: glycosyltransferase family 2 protein [Legionellales bacterium]|jgi:glycosyltransferase involved in cell wall biosynthesis